MCEEPILSSKDLSTANTALAAIRQMTPEEIKELSAGIVQAVRALVESKLTPKLWMSTSKASDTPGDGSDTGN